MMRDIEELLPEVMIFAPSVPEPLALKFIRDAARELCQRTRIWRENDEFDVATPECEALLTVQDARVHEIEEARLDGHPLTPITLSDLDTRLPGWNRGEPLQAQFITQLAPNRFTVVPRQSGTLTLRVVLVPSKDAQSVPDYLIEDHGTTIGKGAAGRIMALPNPEYANPQLGAAYITDFKAELDALVSKVRRGQQKAPQRTKGQYF